MIIHGDTLRELRLMDPESVQCVVTSPPYWGLRDYKIEGQLGLEATLEEYVHKVVEVFREVRRVLRKDGVCWINIGDCYYSNPSNGRGGGSTLGGGKPHLSGVTQRVRPYGTYGRVLQDSPRRDCLLIHLCDVCRGASFSHTVDTYTSLASGQAAGSLCPNQEHTGFERDHLPNADSSHRKQTRRSSFSKLDQRQISSRADAQPSGEQLSTNAESSLPPSTWCWHCDNCGVCLSVFRSSTRDARLCVRRQAYNNGISPIPSSSASHTGRDHNADPYPYSSTAYLKSKDLVGIPWRVAFALQADGWWLRSDIIWAKPNPMPESVTDRPTKSHEYLFLLTKAERYFYDGDAIKEPCAYGHEAKWDPVTDGLGGEDRKTGRTTRRFGKPPAGWDMSTATGDHGSFHRLGREGPNSRMHVDRDPAHLMMKRSGNKTMKLDVPTRPNDHRGSSVPWEGWLRNKRSVWEIATAPYPEAHFATFPEALVEPCILAGTKPGEVVLDPFAGSGTTLAVAKRFGRRYLGIELNPDYVRLAEERLNEISEPLPFA